MRYSIYIISIVAALCISSCKKDWDNHYNTTPATSNENMWDAIQKESDLSEFVAYLKEYHYDTLFNNSNDVYTLFIPNNAAVENYLATQASDSGITRWLINYHISPFFIQSTSIEAARKIQTFSEKYATFRNSGSGLTLDDIPVLWESPVYKNGKFYKIDSVAQPLPNLYEYISLSNPVLKAYIDSKDTLILDKEKSKPLGFDEHGNTIYDSVVTKENKFEWEYYPISEEYRTYAATIVFPKEDSYNAGLTAMAQKLGAGYTDYRDIPMDWQNKILIPYLLEHGVFLNMIEREEFMRKSAKDTVRLQNILGDSVDIDYQIGEKTMCSNGYAYDYSNFKVPDTLYASPVMYEAEKLVRTVTNTVFQWAPFVKITTSRNYVVTQQYDINASNDSIEAVYFNNKYTGTYTIQFNVSNLFPRKYLMVFRTVMRYGGIYNIYCNGKLLRTFNYDDYWAGSGTGVIYSVTGSRYIPVKGYNRFDCWLDNLEVYGNAVIKIEYVGPGTKVPYNGLVLDYIKFIPY
jgi:uncharacterized surface protein with fasciclin (FAS1) repeats